MASYDTSFMGPLDQGDTTSWSLSDVINQGTQTIVSLVGAKNTVQKALSGSSVSAGQDRQDTAVSGKSSNGLMWIVGAVAIYMLVKKA